MGMYVKNLTDGLYFTAEDYRMTQMFRRQLKFSRSIFWHHDVLVPGGVYLKFRLRRRSFEVTDELQPISLKRSNRSQLTVGFETSW